MKKLISALLVICMLCSFVPVSGVNTANASGERSGITVVYDWASQMGGKGDNKQINNDAAFLSQFTYERSNNLWEYESAQTTWATTSWRQYGGKCIQFDRSGGNLWMAFEIYVPKTGWYTVEQNYAKISGTESDVSVYMMAKTGDFAIGNRNDENKIFTLDCKGESSSITAAEPATTDKYIEQGYYYVIYLQVGGGKAYFGNLTLDGEVEKTITEIASVSIPEVLSVGDTGTVTTEVRYSDGTSGTATAGDVVYSSNNSGVLSVDAATGAYTANSAGIATITATAGAVSKSVDVTVGSVEKSGIKVVYDWANQMNGKGDNKQINNDTAFLSQFTFNRSHNLWEYESAQTTWATTSWRQYGGKCIQFDRSGGNLWMAFEIYVPKTGWYTVEQSYAKIGGSESDVDVFMFAKTGDFAIGNRNDGNKIFTLDCKGENSSITAAEPATADKYIEEGYYYVLYLQVGGGKAYFGNLTLNGGEARELVDIEVEKPEYLAVGATGKLSVIAHYSDGTSGVYEEEMSYTSSDDTVVSIDENGVYEAISSGTVVVTVSGNGVEKEVEIDVKGKSGITVVYNWAEQMNPGGGDNQTINNDAFLNQFTFDRSYNFWKYDSRKAWADYTWRQYGGNCIQFNRSGGGLWMVFEIYVPKSGWYTLEQNYAKIGGSESDIDVHVIKKNGESAFSASDMTGGEYKVLTLDCEGESSSIVAAEPATVDKYLEEGYYYIAYAQVGGGKALFGNLTLNGGEERELVTIFFDVPKVIVKGDSGMLAPIGIMSDAMQSQTKEGYVFSSDNEAVLSVNASTGEYTAVGKGNAKITVSYDIGEKNVAAYKNVEVIEGSASGSKLVFDFDKTIPIYGTEKSFSELNNNTDDGTYEFAAASRSASGADIQYRDTFINLGNGEWFAFEIDIPAAGIYAINQKYGKYSSATGLLETYIVPKNGEADFDIGALTGVDAIGNQSCFDSAATDYTESVTAADFGVRFFSEGKYYVVYKANNGSAMFGNLILDGRNTFKKLILSVPERIDVGTGVAVTMEAKSLDMSSVDIKTLDLKCISSDQKTLIAEIGDNNELIIYGENEGVSLVTVTARSEDSSCSKSFNIEVVDASEVESVEIDVSDYTYTRASERCKLIAHMGSGRTIEIPDVEYEIAASEPENIASIDGNRITANAVGKITVKATAYFKGEERTATKEIEIFEGMSKEAPTYYTYEMRENVIENAKKYSWARNEVKAKRESADLILQNVDLYYDMIIGEGLPRARSIRGKGHPDIDTCIYCGEINQQTSWAKNMINRPWKLQCNHCKRLFPSNDFEGFLELGLDEKGYFNIDRARDAHHKMLFHKNGEECACEKPETPNTEEWYEFYGYGNKDGYLYNELYPEVGNESSNVNLLPGETTERWGVDDGFGYLSGRVLDGGVVERFCPVALYNYSLLSGVANEARTLAQAYMYTGESKYGIAGAVLLDRIADVFPDYDFETFDTNAFQTTDGGTGNGKLQGNIQDSYIVKGFATTADMVFPILKDEVACKRVVEYLNPRAEAMNLENKKKSADDIWKNWEENLFMEIFKAAKDVKVSGNFGTYQAAVVAAALVLDKQPESDEMMEWCFKSGEYVYPQNSETGKAYRTGGNIAAQLVDEVDRDGLGTESSASYNCMWWEQLVEIAEMTAKYGNEKYNLYQNVKFLKMLEVFSDLVNVNSHTVHIGDCSSGTASLTLLGNVNSLANMFQYIKDTPVATKVAKYIALYYNYNLDSLTKSIYSKDPEGLDEEIMSFLEDKDGFTESKMLGGYGFAALRAGKDYKSASASTENNNLRDFWIYFGGAKSHRHRDALNLGIEAFGLNMAPDLAYPTDSTVNAERVQWTSTTLSHNTVTVDGQEQQSINLPGKPLYFDDSDKVKVMDVSAPEVYEATSEYRRTVVMIEVDDDTSYGIDFFRILGGNEHIYSFHAQSEADASVNGMTLVPQVDEPQSDWTSEDTSSYAGANVKYGADPNPVTAYNYDTYYPRGTTWLRDVRRSDSSVNGFTADFEIIDYNKAVKDNKDLHLSLTMVNDFELSEVAFAKGKVPTRPTNNNLPTHLEYMLAKRTGKNLDSLFTAVYQPYKKEVYISNIEQIAPTIISGTEKNNDVVKAVKVTHTSGRVDYIIYATNENVTYQLENNADMIFKGFVGVWSVNESGVVIYSYKLGGESNITGKISGFTEGLALENYIDISPDRDVAPESLTGKYIFVDHDGVGNAAYEIVSAEKKENGDIRLDIGTVTTVRSYTDAADVDKGYLFNIGNKQKFVIPMPEIMNANPVFEKYTNDTITVNSTYEKKFTASSPLSGMEVEYLGRALPRGASIDSQTGVFVWKPASSQVGENHVAITARDADGRETTIHFTMTVYGATTGNTSSDKDSSTSENTGSGEGNSGGGAGGAGGAGGGTTAPSKPEEPEKPVDPVVPAEPETPEVTEKFTDLESHAWAVDAINALAEEGIIKGTTATTFSPANNITRADFALLLVRAFKLESDNAENFADVAENDYFASEVAIARNNGIINGIGDNKFAPRKTITRQDMMTIVYRAMMKLGVELKTTTDVEMPDADSVAEYAKEAVEALIGAGIVNGKSGNIAPNDYTTRAEVAVLIKRILEYVK